MMAVSSGRLASAIRPIARSTPRSVAWDPRSSSEWPWSCAEEADRTSATASASLSAKFNGVMLSSAYSLIPIDKT